LRCLGQQPLVEPPQPVAFSPNPVGQLTADYDENGALRLRLALGTAVEDIMLFAQAPCSAGRMKHRRVNYLCLLGPATDGQCDITAPYVARFGQPHPGQKVFVVTCQQKNGWKAQDHVASAIVPPRPLPGEAAGTPETQLQAVAPTETPKAQPAPRQPSSPSLGAVYKGSTPAAPGLHTGMKRVHTLSILCTPLVHGLRVALAKFSMLGMAGIRA
jgi:hypothetical protein